MYKFTGQKKYYIIVLFCGAGDLWEMQFQKHHNIQRLAVKMETKGQ